MEIFSLSSVTRLVNCFWYIFTEERMSMFLSFYFLRHNLTREIKSKKWKKKNKNIPACLPGHLLIVKERIDSSRRIKLGICYSLEIRQNLDKSRKTGLWKSCREERKRDWKETKVNRKRRIQSGTGGGLEASLTDVPTACAFALLCSALLTRQCDWAVHGASWYISEFKCNQIDGIIVCMTAWKTRVSNRHSQE